MESIITSIIAICSAAISGWIAWHFAKKTYYVQAENMTVFNEKLKIITDHDKMLEILYAMYDHATPSDIIWGQSVSGNILGDVTHRIITAAQRGVKFEMIFSQEACKPTSLKKGVVLLFQQLSENATVLIRDDNNIRIQGLSTKELLFALPSDTKYVSIYIKDEAIAKVFRNWFLSRLNSQP